jgi:hypothetical protein
MTDMSSTNYTSTLGVPDVRLVGVASGPQVTPAQRIYFYPPDEWERFILEWATALEVDYQQLKRLGGPGDQGVDVAAFHTRDGFEGDWDCFQGKHYEDPLAPSDALPEVVKLLRHVAAGDYSMPKRYVFLAPKGCGPTLSRLLSNPSKFGTAVLNSLAAGSTYVVGLDESELVRIRALAATIDFSMFESMELLDLLAAHARTPYHVYRFATALPNRAEVGQPPEAPDTKEARYIEQLLSVYSEAHGLEAPDPASIADHPVVGEHFRRQRYSFYSAEALRVYARDSVPPGTFEALVDDVHAGVIDVADAEYRSGMARLSAVLVQSASVQLDNHKLIEVTRPDDRKGICHHLANEDRLTWMRTE